MRIARPVLDLIGDGRAIHQTARAGSDPGLLLVVLLD